MSKHLVCYDTKLTDIPFVELEGKLYWSKRLRFWKWRLHRTMGRPVLMLRKAEK